jgi:hypothetical protein
MSAHDLVFVRKSDGQTIYDPEVLTGSPVEITVTNFGDQDLTGLGFYIVPATNVGDVDNPADYPPHTDYQDLLTWGMQAHLGLQPSGGLKMTLPQNAGTFIGYVTRLKGATYRLRIPFIDLAAGDSATFTIDFETPPGEPARRFYVDLKLE